MILYHPICIAESNHRFVLEQAGENVLIVIGLNPSTADESAPDPTMCSVLQIADAGGYDGFMMLNLSSERSTDPKNLASELDGTMHERNLVEISEISKRYPDADVLTAFGNRISSRKYLFSCLKDIRRVLSGDRRWLRIGGHKGLTKAGHPRHPLYSSPQEGLVEFDIDSYLSIC